MLKTFLLLSALGLSGQPISNLTTITQQVHKNNLKQTNNKLKQNLKEKTELEKDLRSVENYYNNLQRSTSDWSGLTLWYQLSDFLEQNKSKIAFLSIEYVTDFIRSTNNYICYQDYPNSYKGAYDDVVAYYRQIVKDQLIVYLSAKVMQDCLTHFIKYVVDDDLLASEVVNKWFNILKYVFNTNGSRLKIENISKFTKDGYDNVYRLKTFLSDENLKRQLINVVKNKDMHAWKEIQYKYFSFYNFNIYNSEPIYIDGPDKAMSTLYWWYRDDKYTTTYPKNWSNVVRSAHHGWFLGSNISFGVTNEYDFTKDNRDFAIITYSNVTGFVEQTDLFNNYYVDRTDFTDWWKLSQKYKEQFPYLQSLSQIQSLSALMFSTKLERQDLSDVIKNKDIGIIYNTDNQTIIDAINNANPDIYLTLDDVDFFTKTYSSVIISPKPNSLLYKGGSITITYTFQQNLKDIIANTELGELSDVSVDTIFDAIKKANPNTTQNLNKNDINFWAISPQDGSCIITPRNNKFAGEVTLKFKCTFLLDLKTVIKNTDLGKIEQNDIKSILDAINLKNPNINLQDSDVTISEITAHSAKITANRNTKFVGQVIVSFK
ncbi:hypothetical protein NX779_01490 [Mycoplasma cottewii]|uniref:DUF31 domain-containing protein n=1 Tax=Mycoplasma cottewii TaxID=51364 RepID=A0ABY5TX93_9MOLU|nr:hypothetical protein [Mycoplasma cottewii]UWD35293.1 hypothetical protein NX779_01490 [Mycoplasma cottewii]